MKWYWILIIIVGFLLLVLCAGKKEEKGMYIPQKQSGDWKYDNNSRVYH